MQYPLKLDPKFTPAYFVFKDFNARVEASKESELMTIAIERNDGLTEVFEQKIFKSSDQFDENVSFIERLVKSLLWIYGGYKITLSGNRAIYEKIKEIFLQGSRIFDAQFMERIYREKFEVIYRSKAPTVKKLNTAIGKHFNGYRIGFDAGGSDMKVSAVVDGKAIFSEEIIWHPKLNQDPMYHKENIRKAIFKAKEKLPRVDALGVSSAGVYIHNEARVASLFIQVPEEAFDEHIQNIYIDIAQELNVPLVVANDGDVSAIAGSITLGKTKLLGIAMGTSEAAGYVNSEGNIEGWLNELAFVPVDFQTDGPIDEWSLDRGTGNKYFSQDAVIRLAETAGFIFDEKLSLAEKLKTIQNLGPHNKLFNDVFETIGIYLAFALAWYDLFYDIQEVLLLGRVMSGDGGQIIVKSAQKVLENEFPKLASKINLALPDEKFRRLGQSVAAASLVKLDE